MATSSWFTPYTFSSIAKARSYNRSALSSFPWVIQHYVDCKIYVENQRTARTQRSSTYEKPRKEASRLGPDIFWESRRAHARHALTRWWVIERASTSIVLKPEAVGGGGEERGGGRGACAVNGTIHTGRLWWVFGASDHSYSNSDRHAG